MSNVLSSGYQTTLLFSRISQKPGNESWNCGIYNSRNIPTMPPISLSTAGIESLLFNLDTTKASGPDHVPSYVLKHCAHNSNTEAIFKLPTDWLIVNITPVFKKVYIMSPPNTDLHH